MSPPRRGKRPVSGDVACRTGASQAALSLIAAFHTWSSPLSGGLSPYRWRPVPTWWLCSDLFRVIGLGVGGGCGKAGADCVRGGVRREGPRTAPRAVFGLLDVEVRAAVAGAYGQAPSDTWTAPTVTTSPSSCAPVTQVTNRPGRRRPRARLTAATGPGPAGRELRRTPPNTHPGSCALVWARRRPRPHRWSSLRAGRAPGREEAVRGPVYLADSRADRDGRHGKRGWPASVKPE